MMPLALATPGTEYQVLKLNGLEKVQNHLQNLGFVPGSIVELISINDGNVICKIKETRIGLNRDLAMKIMI